jgi:hypothetical protein
VVLTPTGVKTSAYSASPGDFVPVDASAGSVVISLPAAPADGSQVGVKAIAVAVSHAVTIACSGSDVLNRVSGPTSLGLVSLNQAVVLQYQLTTGIWYVLAGDLELNTASGAAQLGSNSTVGGAGGSDLSATVASITSPINSQGGVVGFFIDFAFGQSGTPVTTSEPASVTPIDDIALDPGASLTYDDSVSLAPIPMWVKIATNSGGTPESAAALMAWNSIGQLEYTTHGREYVEFPVLPGQDWRIVEWEQGGTGMGTIDITDGGQVRVGSGDGSTQVGLSATVLSTGTVYRLESSVTRGSSGVVTVSIYAGHSTAPIETFSSTAFATGTYIDQIDFGSVNNSNFGTNPVYMAAFADGCEASAGPYAGPPAMIDSASNQDGSVLYGGFTYDGEFVVYASQASEADSAEYFFQPGQPMLRVTKTGNLILGPSLLANLDYPVGGASLPDGAWNVATGRAGFRSMLLAAPNDPPDSTYTRFGSVNDEQTGTDGSISDGSGGAGNIFSSATIALRSNDINRGITVGGTDYFIASITSATTCTLVDENLSPISLNVTGQSWSIPYAPYPQELWAAGGPEGSIGQPARAVPAARAFIRHGDDGVVNGTTTFTSATAAFTSADTGRYICIDNDGRRVYQITYVNATTVTLSATDPYTASGVPWAICAGDSEGGATPLAIDAATIGFDMGGSIAAHFASDESGEYGPTDLYVALADEELYDVGADIPYVFGLRYDGRVEIPNRLTLTDPSLTSRQDAPTDAQFWRSAVGVAETNALIDAATSGYGVAHRVKNGAPTDGDYPSTPPNGASALNTSGPLSLMARIAGGWVTVAGGAQTAAGEALAARGLIAEAFTPALERSTISVPSGTAYLSLVGLTQGHVVSDIVLTLLTAASGTAPTLAKLGIVSSTGVVLATTANVNSNSLWSGVTGKVGFALSSSYTVPTSGGYYLAVLVVGTWGTTQAAISRVDGNTEGPAMKAYGSGARPFASVTGLSDLGGTLALADPGSGACVWLGAA